MYNKTINCVILMQSSLLGFTYQYKYTVCTDINEKNKELNFSPGKYRLLNSGTIPANALS